MRIEKVNENVVKVFLDSDDLAGRSIELSQIKNNPSDYEELIWDIVEHAEIELGTAITEGHLIVECFTGDTNNLIITITKRDAQAPDLNNQDPVFKKINEHIHNLTVPSLHDILANRRPARFSRVARQTAQPVDPSANKTDSPDSEHRAVPFPEEDIASSLKHNDYDIVLFPRLDDLISFALCSQSFSQLNTALYTFDQAYFLVIRVTKKALPLVNRLETKIADYNATYVPSDVFYPLLQEKGRKLISKNALSVLMETFK